MSSAAAPAQLNENCVLCTGHRCQDKQAVRDDEPLPECWSEDGDDVLQVDLRYVFDKAGNVFRSCCAGFLGGADPAPPLGEEPDYRCRRALGGASRAAVIDPEKSQTEGFEVAAVATVQDALNYVIQQGRFHAVAEVAWNGLQP